MSRPPPGRARHPHTFASLIAGFGCILKIDRAAPFSRDNDIEIPVTVEIDHRNAQARTDSFVIGDNVPGPCDGRAALELVPVDAERRVGVGVIAVMGEESLS